MKALIRISALILALSILFLIVACAAAPSLDPPKLELGDETLEESYIHESYITEQYIIKGEMTSKEVSENRLVAAKIIEQTLAEDIIVSEISVDVVRADQMQGLLDHYFTYETLAYQIDYGQVLADLVEAASVTIVNVVVLSGTALGSIGIAIAVVGPLVFGAISSTISLIKAGIESGGNLGVMKKFAIEGFTSGTVFGAGAVSTVASLSGVSAVAKGTPVTTSSGSVMGLVDKGMKIIDSIGEVVGYITEGGIALDTAGNVVGSIDTTGSLKGMAGSVIPSSGTALDLNGSVKYIVGEGGSVTDASGGKVGFMNAIGMIIAGGLVVGMLGKDGRLSSAFNEAVMSGFKIDLSGTIVNDSYNEGATRYYLDDDGNVIGAEVGALTTDGEKISYLVKAEEVLADKLPDIADALFGEGVSTLIGIINDAGQLIEEWKDSYRKERLATVERAWEMEKALIKSGAQGTRAWTDAEKNELITRGKVSGYVAHYINSPNHNPTLITNPDNIIFLSSNEHAAALSGYDSDTPTYGSLVSRTLTP